MEKKIFSEPEVEAIEFDANDIVTASNPWWSTNTSCSNYTRGNDKDEAGTTCTIKNLSDNSQDFAG